MQEWVNEQYSLVYAVKGQAVKDSIDFSRASWWKCLEQFKNFDFELLEEVTKLVLRLSNKLSVSEKEWHLYTKSKLSENHKCHIVLDPARKNELEQLLFVTKNKSKDIKKRFQCKRYFHIKKFIQQVKLGDIRDVDKIITYHAENLFYQSNISG